MGLSQMIFENSLKLEHLLKVHYGIKPQSFHFLTKE